LPRSFLPSSVEAKVSSIPARLNPPLGESAPAALLIPPATSPAPAIILISAPLMFSA